MNRIEKRNRPPVHYPEIPGYVLNTGPEDRVFSGWHPLAEFWFTKTVHQEHWSLSVCRGAKRFRYHFADEGDPEGYYPVKLALKTTTHLPSFGKLIWMLDHGDFFPDVPGIYFPNLIWPVGEGGEDPDSMEGYVIAHSDYYPALSEWYGQAALFWMDEVKAGAPVWSHVDSIALMERRLSR